VSRMIQRLWDERGVAVLELVLLVPVFVLLVYVVVGMGRLGLARVNIEAAARDAARAGSIARSADDAMVAARTAADATLGSHSITCADLGVGVDTAEFRPGGWVRVEVNCTVSMAKLVGLWAPGDKTMQAQSQAVVDTFRGIS
jgi:Flp pilus assembly protein TadG